MDGILIPVRHTASTTSLAGGNLPFWAFPALLRAHRVRECAEIMKLSGGKENGQRDDYLFRSISGSASSETTGRD